MDKYQEKYLKHQENKRKCLLEIIKKRHSDRVFDDKNIDDKIIEKIIEDTKMCESSCNRHAINIVICKDRDLKSLLGGILVGGVGWIHRASHILLLFADKLAYKAGNEISYMPYIDAGVIIHQLYLTCTSMDLKCCYVNPNIREINIEHFKKIFNDNIFCGAFAIGY